MTSTARRTILVVEDDHKIADVVRIYLERDGFRSVLAVDGQEALQRVDRERPVLIVLDLLLPGLDGREVCRLIRLHSQVPIIMLTALSTENDTLVGLELGADDYISKPFSPRELVARIHTVLRRSERRPPAESESLAVGALRVMPSRHMARLGEVELGMTPAEFALLFALAREPGHTLNRQQLIDAAFGEDFDGFERTIDTHIKNLRRKLAEAAIPGTPEIVTIYGVGYSLPIALMISHLPGARLWHRSLLARFFLSTALILILCVGAIALITYQHTQSAFGTYVTARQAQALTTRGRVLALTIAVLHRRDGNWSGTQALLQDEDANHGTRLMVIDNTGTILADSSNLAVGQHFVRSSNAVVVPIRRRFALRKLGSLALIPIAANQAAQQSFLANVDAGLLLAVVCALGAALVLTYWNVRRVTRPLRAMTGAATRLAGGDLAQRVPAPPLGDEVTALAEAFNRMAASLEETQRQRRALTADIAHELRTPLTSIRGYIEAIQDSAITATPAVIDSIHEEVVQLGVLMGDLQDLALADAGQLDLRCATLPLEPILAQAVAMQEITANQRGIALTYRPATEPLPPLQIDALRLGQVLRNLIANALAHTPAGGSVTVGAGGDAGQVEIIVQDSGQGIAPEHLPHIFERFYRADPSRNRATGGAGIGLSVARSIVLAHGGTIDVHSVVGEGTAFRITLPV